MARARAVVDHDLCAGLSEYQDGPWPETGLAEAADACPMAAITITKDPEQ